MSANDVTVNPPQTACECERDTCAAPPAAPRHHDPTEALRPQNERKSAHAAVARRAGGPRVSETR